MNLNIKPNPPFYGVETHEDGTSTNHGELVEKGMCQYLTDENHWNFKREKEYEFYHILKPEDIYVYIVFGEDIGIQLIPSHFFGNFLKKTIT